MGQFRLKAIKDQAKRGWNKAGDRLAEPTLFDKQPEFVSRTFLASLRNGVSACVGDKLLLQASDELTRGPLPIAYCKNPPAEIVERRRNGGALCVEVVGVNPLSNTIEITSK
jgi:hypothetical protein